MPTLSYPFALTAGQPENVNQLTANLDAVKTVVNSLDTANLVDGAVTSAKIADGTIALGDLATSALNAHLKLLVSADRKLALGVGNATVQTSSLLRGAVSHGFGAPPTFAVATLINSGNAFSNISYLGVFGMNTATVTFDFQTINGVTVGGANNSDFLWLAIS
jgi:hypothetical protein